MIIRKREEVFLIFGIVRFHSEIEQVLDLDDEFKDGFEVLGAYQAYFLNKKLHLVGLSSSYNYVNDIYLEDIFSCFKVKDYENIPLHKRHRNINEDREIFSELKNGLKGYVEQSTVVSIDEMHEDVKPWEIPYPLYLKETKLVQEPFEEKQEPREKGFFRKFLGW